MTQLASYDLDVSYKEMYIPPVPHGPEPLVRDGAKARISQRDT